MPTMAIRSIASEALDRQLNSGAVTVIDVRDPDEFLSGHIRGSLNIPLAEITTTGLPDGPLVMVCQSGRRSARAIERLLEERHPEPVSDLAGGLNAWRLAHLPLEGPGDQD